jgi:hypothetical protein
MYPRESIARTPSRKSFCVGGDVDDEGELDDEGGLVTFEIQSKTSSKLNRPNPPSRPQGSLVVGLGRFSDAGVVGDVNFKTLLTLLKRLLPGWL